VVRLPGGPIASSSCDGVAPAAATGMTDSDDGRDEPTSNAVLHSTQQWQSYNGNIQTSLQAAEIFTCCHSYNIASYISHYTPLLQSVSISTGLVNSCNSGRPVTTATHELDMIGAVRCVSKCSTHILSLQKIGNFGN